MSLAVSVARFLERGQGGGLAGAASRVWERAASRRVSRPLTYREGACVIAVGGATLGGSGKSPVAVACARWLAERGVGVALVGHAYRARPPRAMDVTAGDSVDIVGDEALDAARALSGLSAHVVVAPTRQKALDLGLCLASVVILDGVAQCSPRRATLALLAVDGGRPWGAGHCPPRGDLRAARSALVAACDRVVSVGSASIDRDISRPVDVAAVVSRGVAHAHSWLGWGDVRRLRVGLITSVARPDRVLRLLAERDVVPRTRIMLSDHASAAEVRAPTVNRAVGAAETLDLWLCTSKCAARLPPRLGKVPVAVIDYALVLPESLAAALSRGVDARKNGP